MLYYSTTRHQACGAVTIKIIIATLGWPMIGATGRLIVVLLAELSFNYDRDCEADRQVDAALQVYLSF